MGLDHSLSKNGNTVITWRKENHIHKWFLDNCKDSEDNAEFPVKNEELQQFLTTCQFIMEAYKKKYKGEKKKTYDLEEAEKLMPTLPGFFFGDTTYSIYYFESLEECIKNITPSLEGITEDSEEQGFKYWSWW